MINLIINGVLTAFISDGLKKDIGDIITPKFWNCFFAKEEMQQILTIIYIYQNHEIEINTFKEIINRHFA